MWAGGVHPHFKGCGGSKFSKFLYVDSFNGIFYCTQCVCELWTSAAGWRGLQLLCGIYIKAEIFTVGLGIFVNEGVLTVGLSIFATEGVFIVGLAWQSRFRKCGTSS